MQILDSNQLSSVIGGWTKTTTNSDGTTSTSGQSNYDSCRQAMERRAAEVYPDTRTWLGRWFGTTDENAERRAAWLRDGSQYACGPAPKS